MKKCPTLLPPVAQVQQALICVAAHDPRILPAEGGFVQNSKTVSRVLKMILTKYRQLATRPSTMHTFRRRTTPSNFEKFAAIVDRIDAASWDRPQPRSSCIELTREGSSLLPDLTDDAAMDVELEMLENGQMAVTSVPAGMQEEDDVDAELLAIEKHHGIHPPRHL